ncbi:MAG TPA: hypothetical protein V6C69_10450 [Trichormus sp.]|jgi:hypothetical protein
MKRNNVHSLGNSKVKTTAPYMVTQRLDESLPLQTEEWQKVEQLLMRISEFAPSTMLTELVNTMATWADDQARRGYILGQEDLMHEIKRRTVA